MQFHVIKPKIEVIAVAFTTLSEYLTDFYGSQCVVLVDEFDHPVDIAFQNNYFEAASDTLEAMFGSLLKVSVKYSFKPFGLHQ